MTKSSETEEIDVLDQLVEQFVCQHRNGTCKSIDEFIAQHPRWANALNEILPAVAFLDHTLPSVPPVLHGSQSFPSIHDYHFIRELGRGGMGVVYQAEHIALGRQVAVKVLSLQLIPSEKARVRFQREARAAARMHHSNIVPVFEIGQSGETSFYSMQLIEGENLDDRIKRLRSTHSVISSQQQTHEHYRHVAKLGVSMAHALQYAHDQRVLHRDIKPSNVLMDLSETAWLSDFGLASISDERVANTEELAGTLRYLAPERLKGQCNERSDIYSLGLTLYEYATLSPAFGSLQRAELINPNRKLPRLYLHAPAIPKDLAKIIEKSIRNEPEARFANAAELASDLQNFLDGKPINARPVSPLERLWMWGKRNPSVATLAFSLNVLLLTVTLGAILVAVRFQGLNQDTHNAKSQAIRALELAQVHAVKADEQATIAEQNEKLAKHVSSYFARMIQGADPSGLFTGHAREVFPIDQATTAFEWIAQSAKLIEAEDFSDAPLVEAELKDTLGVALTGQMRMADAAPLLKRGLEIRTQLLDANHLDIANSLEHLGTFNFYAGDPLTASDYFRKALAIRELQMARLISESPNAELIKEARLAKARNQSALGLALEYSAQHPSPIANDLLQKSLATRIELLGAEHEEVAYCYIALASILAREVKPEQALEELQKAERILTKSHGDHRLSQVFSLYAQGTALQSARMTDAAIDRFSKAEVLMTELFGSSHPLTVYARGEVAGALERGGHPEKAEAIYKRVIEFNHVAMAKQPFLAQSWDTLGICYRGQNKIPEATEAFENALRIYGESGLLADHFLVAMTKKRLADCYVISGRAEEAYATLKEAAKALESLPKEVVGIELATGLAFMSYLSLWHQIDKYPEVIEAVVRVGQDEADPSVIEHLMNAGTSGHCTAEQAETLMAMNARWLAAAKDEHSESEAMHFRGRILWQAGQFDNAIEVLKAVQPSERRRYQADLFISLCWKGKRDSARAESLFLEAVNGIVPRLPVHFANALRDRTTDRITAKPDEMDPATPIEFPWEQTAYSEFAWRTLQE